MLQMPGYIGWMSYVERLRVPLWWWLVALALVASLAMAVLAYVPLVQGITVVGLLALAMGMVVFAYGHTAIRVTGTALHVGRHVVQGRWIAGVEALGRAESAHAMAGGADTRDFLVTRPYIGDLVRVTLNDAADPHPHWLVSSRRAEQLAEAVHRLQSDKS
ncbi:DUF3093 domain-containing protein [Tessaracoccus sp.]